jgi:hypothetical protein
MGSSLLRARDQDRRNHANFAIGGTPGGMPGRWGRPWTPGATPSRRPCSSGSSVLGANDVSFTLTAHAKAHGWDAAFGAGD